MNFVEHLASPTLNPVEQCEKRLRDFAGIKGPYTSGLRKRALEYVLRYHNQILEYEELGLAKMPLNRQALAIEFLKYADKHHPRDVGFSVWLLDHAMGSRSPGSAIFYRCAGCFKIRTYRRTQRGACRCGSRSMNGCIGNIQPIDALRALVTGY